jgi:hypothetical protein
MPAKTRFPRRDAAGRLFAGMTGQSDSISSERARNAMVVLYVDSYIGDGQINP